VQGEALVIVRGPDAYISPSWYVSKAEHGRVVPTWNYLTAHVYGRLVVHDDPTWVGALVRRLTDKHETDSALEVAESPHCLAPHPGVGKSHGIRMYAFSDHLGGSGTSPVPLRPYGTGIS
jgi:predicted FMN-binding regulatory protein PaiB